MLGDAEFHDLVEASKARLSENPGIPPDRATMEMFSALGSKIVEGLQEEIRSV